MAPIENDDDVASVLSQGSGLSAGADSVNSGPGKYQGTVPEWLSFREEGCRAIFTSKTVGKDGELFVCGAGASCSRPNHKALKNDPGGRAEVGNYRTRMTGTYVDGVYGTHLSDRELGELLDERRAHHREEAAAMLTSGKATTMILEAPKATDTKMSPDPLP